MDDNYMSALISRLYRLSTIDLIKRLAKTKILRFK